MIQNLNDIINFDKEQVKPVLVVRVDKNFYRNKSGEFVSQTKLRVMKKLSFLSNVFEEDFSCCGPEDTIDRIVNLYEVKPGLYEMITVNQTTDWETGYIDGWDYLLIPYKNS